MASGNVAPSATAGTSTIGRHDHHADHGEERAAGAVLIGPAEERRERRDLPRQRDGGDGHGEFERGVGPQRLHARERRAQRPPAAAPSARPSRNAPTTVLAAAVVWPRCSVSSRVQVTS